MGRDKTPFIERFFAMVLIKRSVAKQSSFGTTMQPVTQYAKSGDIHIAYQAFGEGPINLVMWRITGMSPTSPAS
jgi:hypothetical protein